MSFRDDKVVPMLFVYCIIIMIEASKRWKDQTKNNLHLIGRESPIGQSCSLVTILFCFQIKWRHRWQYCIVPKHYQLRSLKLEDFHIRTVLFTCLIFYIFILYFPFMKEKQEFFSLSIFFPIRGDVEHMYQKRGVGLKFMCTIIQSLSQFNYQIVH